MSNSLSTILMRASRSCAAVVPLFILVDDNAVDSNLSRLCVSLSLLAFGLLPSFCLLFRFFFPSSLTFLVSH
eukprot:m.39101 g.39101  ORF g.39101 m.39101 type:complete len:72 (-) comp11559_c0_seq2:268-483(-)